MRVSWVDEESVKVGRVRIAGDKPVQGAGFPASIVLDHSALEL